MKRKFWPVLAVCFSVETFVGYFLTDAWTSHEMIHVGAFLLATGVLGLLVSLMALAERPAAAGGQCPCCGAPVRMRGRGVYRRPGDAERHVVRCPRCGTMFQP